MIVRRHWLCVFVSGFAVGFITGSSSASAWAQQIWPGTVALKLAAHESRNRTQIAKPAMQDRDGAKAQLPHATPMERCTLHWMSKKVRLFSMVRVTDTMLLQHFLRHYHNLGVQLSKNARFVLQEGETPRSASSEVLRVLRQYNVSDYVFVQNYSSQLKAQLVNEYLATLQKGLWVLYPDIDEFFDFPCDLSKRIAQGIYAFWGKMADRLGPNFTMPTLKATPDIHEQFPISCPDMRTNLSSPPKIHGMPRHNPLNTKKHMLFKTSVNSFRTYFFDSHNMALLPRDPITGNLTRKFAKRSVQKEFNCLGYFAHFTYAGSDVLQKWKAKQDQYAHNPWSHVVAQRNYMQKFIDVDESGMGLTLKGLRLASRMCVDTSQHEHVPSNRTSWEIR